MKNIVLASSNPHKLDEIRLMLNTDKISFELAPPNFNPIENGNTFEDNSFIKAQCASNLTHKYSLADDAGLCVNALNGRPGIYSARYATTQEEKINKLLLELSNIPYEKRTAKFVCVMTLCNPNGELIYQSKGEIEGHIIEAPKGKNGFGYDPIFYIDNIQKTMAEMSMNEKNTLSHRAIALKKIIKFLQTNYF